MKPDRSFSKILYNTGRIVCKRGLRAQEVPRRPASKGGVAASYGNGWPNARRPPAEKQEVVPKRFPPPTQRWPITPGHQQGRRAYRRQLVTFDPPASARAPGTSRCSGSGRWVWPDAHPRRRLAAMFGLELVGVDHAEAPAGLRREGRDEVAGLGHGPRYPPSVSPRSVASWGDRDPHAMLDGMGGMPG
jgi:hypothetical protein